MIINGLKIANEILAELKKLPKPDKKLVAILVNDDPASISFLKQKAKTAEHLGVDFQILNFPKDIRETQLISEIEALNNNQRIGGVIVQLPMPDRLDRAAVISAIVSKKDVDNLKNGNLVVAPAVAVVEEILSRLKFSLKGKKSAVVGRGLLVGEPVANWLKKHDTLVANLHTENFDENVLRKADLIVSGAGQPGLIKGGAVKKDSILIDFGTGFLDGKSKGDFDFESCAKKALVITPTPGGTGPILVAKLFENFYKLTFGR